MEGTRRACVLLSGGVDSALVSCLLSETGTTLSALFVDYGQPAALAERAASRAVAEHLALPWRQVEFRGLSVAP